MFFLLSWCVHSYLTLASPVFPPVFLVLPDSTMKPWLHFITASAPLSPHLKPSGGTLYHSVSLRCQHWRFWMDGSLLNLCFLKRHESRSASRRMSIWQKRLSIIQWTLKLSIVWWTHLLYCDSLFSPLHVVNISCLLLRAGCCQWQLIIDWGQYRALYSAENGISRKVSMQTNEDVSYCYNCDKFWA